MKQFLLFLVVLSLCPTPALRGQDATTEERLNKLTGLVQDLQESREIQSKQIESLAKEVRTLREQQNQPKQVYASQDDLRNLAGKLQEIVRKRQADNKLILKEIENLGKVLKGTPPPKKQTPKTKSTLAAPPSTRGQ